MESNMDPIRNQELDADQFTNLQHNAPTIMEDRGIVNGERLMILHLEPVVKQDDHADLESDFTHLDDDFSIEYRFEACGRCMELGIDHMFKKMVADVQLPDDLKSEDGK